MQEKAQRYYSTDTNAAEFVHRPHIRSDKPTKTVYTGYVLLSDAGLDWAAFQGDLLQCWNISFAGKEKYDSALFNFEDAQIAISLMPAKIPGQQVEQAITKSPFLPAECNLAQEYQAHVLLALMAAESTPKQQALFIKVAASLLQLPNALAFYAPPAVYAAEYYVRQSLQLKDGALPAGLLRDGGLE